MKRQWQGETPQQLVAQDICPKCFGELDTGWECNDCGYDCAHLVIAEPVKKSEAQP